MRSMLVKTLLAVVASVGAAGCSSSSNVEAQGVAEKEVLQAQVERFRAIVGQDVPALERIIADDLWYCRPSGYCEDKEHFIKFAAAQKIQSMKPMRAKATVFGDVAILSGQFEQVNSSTTPPNHFLNLETWVKRDGRWQLAKFLASDPPNDVHRFNDCKELGDVFNPNNRWLGYYLGGTKTGAEKDVLQAQMERFRAQVAGDSKAAVGLLADELLYCPASGHCQDKTKHLQTVAGKPSHIPSGVKVLEMWPEHMKVDVYGDIATVVGRINEINTTGDSTKLNTDNYLVLEIYLKRDGRWQLVGFGANDIPGWSPFRCRGKGLT